MPMSKEEPTYFVFNMNADGEPSVGRILTKAEMEEKLNENWYGTNPDGSLMLLVDDEAGIDELDLGYREGMIIVCGTLVFPKQKDGKWTVGD